MRFAEIILRLYLFAQITERNENKIKVRNLFNDIIEKIFMAVIIQRVKITRNAFCFISNLKIVCKLICFFSISSGKEYFMAFSSKIGRCFLGDERA
jgi:hypothetical protein